MVLVIVDSEAEELHRTADAESAGRPEDLARLFSVERPLNGGEDAMSAGETVAHVSSAGSRRVFHQGAGNEGPRPIDDEEFESVAGGVSHGVTFRDGCVMTFHGLESSWQASLEANELHRATGHTNNDHGVEVI